MEGRQTERPRLGLSCGSREFSPLSVGSRSPVTAAVSSIRHPHIHSPPLLLHLPRSPPLLPGVPFQVKSLPRLCLSRQGEPSLAPCCTAPSVKSHVRRNTQVWTLTVLIALLWAPPTPTHGWCVCPFRAVSWEWVRGAHCTLG